MARDDIKGNRRFELRTGDSKVPYEINITECSSGAANDGWLPYNSTINSVSTFTIKKDDGTDITSDILEGSASLSGDLIQFSLNYPSINGAGEYTIWTSIAFTNDAVARVKTIKAARIKVF